MPAPSPVVTETAALVSLVAGAADAVAAEQSLEELAGLAAAAGARVALRLRQERPKPDPATFIGRGKVDMLVAACDEQGIDIVIFDNELTPAQLRNLDRALGRKVIDRTQLILDIFARRARTREGKLQVELAQLKYAMPRLVGSSEALSRLGGGIGTRGPGETKLETDRRRIRQRIAALSKDIESVRRRRTHLRERRAQSDAPTVALVGYTNAGKTTLFNRLTHAKAAVSDALFVTLDPLVRRVRTADGSELMLSDTVGFIDRLPHELVAAFRATLEEAAEADLLLHVVDAASEDCERRMTAVRRVIDEIGGADTPTLIALNKSDRLDASPRERLALLYPSAVFVSARSGDGCDALLDAIVDLLSLDARRVTLEFDAGAERTRHMISRLYQHGRVVRHETIDGRVAIEADVPRRWLARLGHDMAPGGRA